MKNKKNTLSKKLINSNTRTTWKWRAWHEREIPVKVFTNYKNNKIKIEINSKLLKNSYEIDYPMNLFVPLPQELKNRLINNISYVYTAHIPLALNKNVRLVFNTEYPQIYSWASQSFMKFLPAYWHIYNSKRGTHILPILKTILNTTYQFIPSKDKSFHFPKTSSKNVVIPFTFGKDSLLTYKLAKILGLDPILFWINDPLSKYESKHKLKLFKKFKRSTKDKIVCIDSEPETLRDLDIGWFGWEIPLTAWALLAIPVAYKWKAKYIVFSNEKSCNAFSYDKDGLRIIPDYEQSLQAIDEISLITQSLSNNNIFTTSFLQGLDELCNIALLKKLSPDMFKFLMSCGEAHESDKSRWCCSCSKCARLYLYLSANGVDPRKEAGFTENMFSKSKGGLYNVFGKAAKGELFDAFGLNTEEQALAFYLCYLRGIDDPLVVKFCKTPLFKKIKKNIDPLIEEYFSHSKENSMPHVYKDRLYRLFDKWLKEIRKEFKMLANKEK